MTEFDPDELPAEETCPSCGETHEIPSSWQKLFDDDGQKIPGTLGMKTPTSKRIQKIYWCPCGRRLASIRDPHWPGGASGGYVENP